MLELLLDYGLFLMKGSTVLVLAIILLTFSYRLKRPPRITSELTAEPLNDQFKQYQTALLLALNDKKAIKKLKKDKSKPHKRLFLIQFKGDIKASGTQSLREEISAILTTATSNDEVVLILESTGGTVHGYGLAASQLTRLKQAGIKLTICVDKVAASGGYMMAVVADHLIAAPFAMIGSIGVIASLPNFNRLLKKQDIDFEQITAGEYKRTLTLFGENTEKDRTKFKADIDVIHNQFKDHILTYRPQLDINSTATGEIWQGVQAKKLGLIDELGTSDDLLMKKAEDTLILNVKIAPPKNMLTRLKGSAASLLASAKAPML